MIPDTANDGVEKCERYAEDEKAKTESDDALQDERREGTGVLDEGNGCVVEALQRAERVHRLFFEWILRCRRG